MNEKIKKINTLEIVNGIGGYGLLKKSNLFKEENIIDEKVDENKNSNVLGIILMQPIIKKKKKNKI